MKPLITVMHWVTVYNKRKGKYKFPRYAGTFNLNKKQRYHRKTGKQYFQLLVETEKELVTFLRDTFGFGEYTILAHIKGKQRSFVFWKGEINPDFWVFQEKSQYDEEDRKQIDEMDKEINRAQDPEEAEIWKEHKEDIIKDAKDREKKRYGFYPFLKSSGRRGDVHYWTDPDLAKEKISSGGKEESPELELPEQMEVNKKPKGKNFKEMNLDDINNF